MGGAQPTVMGEIRKLWVADSTITCETSIHVNVDWCPIIPMYNVNAIGAWQIHSEPVQILFQFCAEFDVDCEWALAKGGEHHIDKAACW